MRASVLLISHNGARWLPAVVKGVEQQTVRPERYVGVDTGSRDESVSILRASGVWDVEKIDTLDSFGAAVARGLERLPAAADGEPEWIWLLHDDSAPDPRALEHLLTAARENPGVAIFGPKLREWPSLRRLLELGVTISGNGRRETGLERGEYDQGQHDVRRVVLAVNTAGMLVRRDVLEQLGIDPTLPLYGNDIDFGWRAARAGHDTMIVPEALVFHAEAAARGLRKGRLTERHHRDARTAAVRTLLVNGSGRGLPLRAIRLLLLGLLRAIGYLLIRAPREAWGEVSSLLATLGRPGRLAAARRRRARAATVPPAQVRHLLAPAWLPVRHVLDDAADLGSALVDLGRERIGGRSVRTAHTVDPDDDDAALEPSLLGLLVTDPRLWIFVGSILLGLVAARDLIGGGAINGGALPAAPGGVGSWWSSWWSGHHSLGTGSSAPAPAYVLPLAVLGTLLLGQPGWAVGGIFVLGVPFAFLSAVRFYRRVVPGRWLPLWAAATYALIPVVTGAVAQGRIGTVVGAMVLPWVATSALGLRRAEADPRWRAIWRTAIGLGLLAAFAPTAWLVAAVLLGVLLVHGLVTDRAQWRKREWWGGPLVMLLSTPVLLLPWFVGVLSTPGALLVEAGRASALPQQPDSLAALLGRLGGPGSAPAWIGIAVVALALLGLVRAEVRGRVLVVWLVAAAGAVVVLLCSVVTVHLPGLATGFHPYAGFPLLVVQAGLVSAGALAAGDLREVVAHGGGWRPAVAIAGFAAGVVALLGGAGWWVVAGGSGPVHRGSSAAEVPAYMADLAGTQPEAGVLLLRGDLDNGVRYEVLRDGPLTLGNDAIAALTPPDDRLTGAVQRLLADPQPIDAKLVARYGVAYVYAPAPVSQTVAGPFDAGAGFSRASATGDDAAWRLQYPASLANTHNDGQPVHLLWVLVQLLAIVSGIVLAMPTRRVVG